MQQLHAWQIRQLLETCHARLDCLRQIAAQKPTDEHITAAIREHGAQFSDLSTLLPEAEAREPQDLKFLNWAVPAAAFTDADLTGFRLAVADRLTLLRGKNEALPGRSSILRGIRTYEVLYARLNRLLDELPAQVEGARCKRPQNPPE